jgi:hypothetical protein
MSIELVALLLARADGLHPGRVAQVQPCGVGCQATLDPVAEVRGFQAGVPGSGDALHLLVYFKTAGIDAFFVKDRAIGSFDAVGDHLLMDIESHKILVDSVFFKIEIG